MVIIRSGYLKVADVPGIKYSEGYLVESHVMLFQ